MKKRQIVFIHGGEAYSDYSAFLNTLRARTVADPFSDKEIQKWYSTLRTELLHTHDVAYLSMPNKQNAHYNEWKLWFERHLQFFRDGVILMGYSLGGLFLVKYLSENVLTVRSGGLYLLATPFGNDDFGGGEDGGDFVCEQTDFSRITQQIPRVYLFHSHDDPVVPYAHATQYQRALGVSQVFDYPGKGHFFGISEFPELIEHIRSVENTELH